MADFFLLGAGLHPSTGGLNIKRSGCIRKSCNFLECLIACNVIQATHVVIGKSNQAALFHEHPF